MKEINDAIKSNGDIGFMLAAYANGSDDNLYVMEAMPTDLAVRKNLFINRLSGLTGYCSKNRTIKAINWIDSFNPDIIHIHNIHGDWINLKLLFNYIKERKYPIVWTLHDCWAFTGRCSYFEDKQCTKWLKGCHDCPDLNVYPKSYFFDYSKKMYKDKKEWLLGLPSVNIVTPSKWLADYVRESFLGCYDISVINNGIDLSLFEPQEEKSRYLLNEKRNIILGVAASWTPRKGLDDFLKLHSVLDSSKYVIVIVGLNSKQVKALPSGMIGIMRTQNVKELAQLYSSATVFVNPTYQDNYPTVNLEAIACGTPVITYRTGGSVESVTDKTGRIVDKGDIDSLAKAIMEICNSNQDYFSPCTEFARNNFGKSSRYQEYIDLYEKILR